MREKVSEEVIIVDLRNTTYSYAASYYSCIVYVYSKLRNIVYIYIFFLFNYIRHKMHFVIHTVVFTDDELSWSWVLRYKPSFVSVRRPPVYPTRDLFAVTLLYTLFT